MADLCQIRKGYRSQWRDLVFSVEGGASQWTLRVHAAGATGPLYEAERCAAGPAKVAAVEFAVFHEFGPASPLIPAQLARDLSWQEYW